MFLSKIERRKYNASLAITGAIKGTSHAKLYKELGLESLRFRRSFRRLCRFLKIKTSGKPEYLLDLIPACQHSYNIQSLDQVETYYCRTNTSRNPFSSYKIVERHKFDLDIRKSKSWNLIQSLGMPC